MLTNAAPNAARSDPRFQKQSRTKRAKRVGLFGGSFDPVHLGHLLVARAALEEFQLDRLFFIPAFRSPFKPDRLPAPPMVRARLLRLALAGWTRCEIDLQEIRRGGVSYTIDTAREYRRRFPQAELYWIIGADHVPKLPRWREAEALARLVRFISVPRPGMVSPKAPEPFQVNPLSGFPFAVSSSAIRARVARGEPIDLLTPPAVGEAILKMGLYRRENLSEG
ncbi:MAG: nicotinate-nucleotide adenylyltransferase [Verrucomicrobia bacterium]|nr:nicotinate-nucleotide adenylyltransferase [Verrucomicrobiota bacterium]